MTTELFGASLETDRSHRAKEAVRVFRGMQPGLTGFARALTGKKHLTVEIAEQGGSTDGKKIYFKPPIALGDKTPHERSLCDKRDAESLLLRCPACRVREEVLITIYHEIAHIAFGTFVKPTEQAKARAVEAAIGELGTKYATRIRKQYEELPDYKKDDYLNLSSIISPFLPTIVNAIEDARVDEQMFQARKGTRKMFDAMTLRVFQEGYEEADGTRTMWWERPLNSQIIIGVFVLSCRYKYEGWFDPEVEAALSDEQLVELCHKADSLSDAHESYGLAFKILARLRELGFCLNPDEPQDEEESEDGDSVRDEESEGDPSEGQDPEEGDDGDSEGDDESSGAGNSESDSDSSPDGDDDGGSSEGSGDSGPEGESGEEGSGDSDGSSDGDGDERAEADGGSTGESASGDRQPEGEGGSGGSEAEAGGDDRSPGPDGDEVGGGSDESDGEDHSGGSGSGTGREGRGAGEDLTDDQTTGSGGSDSESSDGDSGGSHESSPESSMAPSEVLRDAEGSDSGDDGLGDPEGDREDDRRGDPVDTGADEGKGGIEVEHRSRPKMGDAEDVERDIIVFTGHDLTSQPVPEASAAADDEAMSIAVVQGMYFESSSVEIAGVRESKFGETKRPDGSDVDAWSDRWSYYYGSRIGRDVDMTISETILGPALLELRRVFADNQRASFERHLTSGKINAKVLGKRAWAGDDRLFQKKRIPGKKSYAVLLGVDISASTIGVNIGLAKRAAMAQAQLLHRAGIEFAVYAHSGDCDAEDREWLDIYEIKSFDAPWGPLEQKALSELQPAAENLDGHTLEYYRKKIEQRPETDKVILYYSDGQMPAENYHEELEILEREILNCKRQRITLLGVGIRTDSPRRHGLDTVEVHDDSDVIKVIRHLKNALLHTR